MKDKIYFRLQLGRMEFTLSNRFWNRTEVTIKDYNEFGKPFTKFYPADPLFQYLSYCYPSESIYVGPFEFNIQNRRKPV